jgi:hypothetical protein
VKLDDPDKVLDQVVAVMAANTKKMSVLGARSMVLGKFLEAALPQLTTLQRGEITWSFREGIEEAMSLMDDLTLPAEYHAAMLELTNDILAALGGESNRRQYPRP